MAEFATEWTDAKLTEFRTLDANDDGLLTATEALQSKALSGGTYSNLNAEVLPPRKTIISKSRSAKIISSPTSTWNSR